MRRALFWGYPTKLAGFIVVIACSYVVLSATAHGQSRIEMVNKVTTNDVYTQNRILSRKLNQEVNLEFHETPFEAVLIELRKTLNAQVIIDPSARDDSLSADTLITFRLANTRLRTALEILLEHHNSTYLIHDGVLKIISLDASSAPEFHRKRVFDARPLLMLIAESEAKFPFNLSTPIPRGTGSGNQNGGIFNLSPRQPSSTSNQPSTTLPQDQSVADQKMQNFQLTLARRQASTLLIDTIKISICPDEWDDTNGDAAIDMIGGLLIVSASENCLNQIEDLLIEFEQVYQVEKK